MGNKVAPNVAEAVFGKFVKGTFDLIKGLSGGDQGGKDIKETIEYKKEPELLNQIYQLRTTFQSAQRELKQSQALAKSKKDPKLFKQLKANTFENFLNNIRNYNFPQRIQKSQNQNLMMCGRISTGKSSFLNKVFKTELKVGMGETTQDIKAIFKNDKVNIYDSPGFNDDFNYEDYEILAIVANLDVIIICYCDSLETTKDFLRIIAAVRSKETYLFRTKCDLFSEKDKLSIDEELQRDRKLLKEKVGVEFPILATSANNSMKFRDNAEAIKILRGNF